MRVYAAFILAFLWLECSAGKSNLSGQFTSKNMAAGPIAIIAAGLELIVTLFEPDEEEYNPLIEQNMIIARQTEILERGLATVTTSITESMKELIDSMKEANYKEMMLLVDFYTRNIVADCLRTTGKFYFYLRFLPLYANLRNNVINFRKIT